MRTRELQQRVLTGHAWVANDYVALQHVCLTVLAQHIVDGQALKLSDRITQLLGRFQVGHRDMRSVLCQIPRHADPAPMHAQTHDQHTFVAKIHL